MDALLLSKPAAREQLDRSIGHLMLVADAPVLKNKEGADLTEHLERAVEFRRLGAEVWESRLSQKSIERVEGGWGDHIEELRKAVKFGGIPVNEKVRKEILDRVAELVADVRSISHSMDAFVNYRAAFVEKVINEGEKQKCKELMIAGYNALLEGGNRHLEYLENRLAFCEKYNLHTDKFITDVKSERNLNNLRKKQIERLEEAASNKEALQIMMLTFDKSRREAALSSYEALHGNLRE